MYVTYDFYGYAAKIADLLQVFHHCLILHACEIATIVNAAVIVVISRIRLIFRSLNPNIIP